MPSRVTRGALAAAEDFASLSSRDRLIFAQAVYEYGARQAAWAEIAKLLSKHPLISRPKNFFTVQSCVAIYSYLMGLADLERTDLCETKKSPINAQLAQKFYRDRVAELRDEIAAEEERFKSLVTEIEEIRAGKWDDRILAKLQGTEVPLVEPPAVPELPESMEVVIEGNAAPLQSGEEPQVKNEVPVQILGSEGEAPMDVSSPVRASSPSLELVPPTDTPKPTEEQVLEQSTTEGRSSQASGADEQVPSSPKQMHKTRSRTRKEPVEAVGNSAPETVEVEEVPLVIAEEQQNEEPQEAAVAAPEITPDGPTPDLTVSREDETVEPASYESTPAPQDRKEGKRRGSDFDLIESSRDKKRPRDESEPVESAESPATPSALISGPGTKNMKERKRFQSVISMLHAQITAHRNGTIFHHPIKPSEAPDYHDIVKRPMDLKTIKNRVKDGRISTSGEYQRDIYLMFANSLMYNRPNSDIYMMAEEMMLDSEAEIQNFQQTEAYNLRTRG